jgi:hypothetical protein
VNETGHSENCFWIDGKLHRLGPVAFEFDRRDLMKTWNLRDSDGRLELEFTPEGMHTEKTNAFIAATNFQQMFGRYRGMLQTRDGETIEIQGHLGYAERHYSKW